MTLKKNSKPSKSIKKLNLQESIRELWILEREQFASDFTKDEWAILCQSPTFISCVEQDLTVAEWVAYRILKKKDWVEKDAKKELNNLSNQYGDETIEEE